MNIDTITDTGTDSVRTGRLDVGSSFIEVRPGVHGHVLLAVHERKPDQHEDNDVTLTLPTRVLHAARRSLRLAVRLATGSDTRTDGHPLWCDPSSHAANWQRCGWPVGEFHFGRQTLEVVLHRQRPDTAPTMVGLYAGHEHGPDAVVDMPAAAALELARLLWKAEGTDVPWYGVGVDL